MTDDRTNALALLRGVNTSLLHLLATAPIYALTPIAEAYKSARTAIRILEFRSAGDHEQSASDAVAFRHGDINQVCGLDRDPHEILEEIAGIRDAGEFTQPPNCGHPMAAERLRMADEQPCNQPRRSESAWSVTWPSYVTRPCEKPAEPQTEYQTLVGN